MWYLLRSHVDPEIQHAYKTNERWTSAIKKHLPPLSQFLTLIAGLIAICPTNELPVTLFTSCHLFPGTIDRLSSDHETKCNQVYYKKSKNAKITFLTWYSLTTSTAPIFPMSLVKISSYF